MTWGEFKAWMHERGVRDQDTIGYIDISCAPSEVRLRDDPSDASNDTEIRRLLDVD